MKITHLRTNHIVNPIGYMVDMPTVSYVVEESTGNKQCCARIEVATDSAFNGVVYDTGKCDYICPLGHDIKIDLGPYTRYYWRVTVWADNGDTGTSDVAYFETGKLGESWTAQWIAAPFDKAVHPLIVKDFAVPTGLVSARAYICGLGVYELEINGKKVGSDYLEPFYNDYNNWIQYITYDVTDCLINGDNRIGLALGNGWYKGRFGFMAGMGELYGDQMKCIAEIRLTLSDGSVQVIHTDTSWLCKAGPVQESSIYDGEVYDANQATCGWSKFGTNDGFVNAVIADAPAGALTARLSPPNTIIEKIKPVELIHTPIGETVIDFGQIMTGWVEFDVDLPKGSVVKLQYGEIMQKDVFYNDNLRSAKQAYTYTSDGKKAHVRPYFTFYGFRFVKVEGIDKINLDDFIGCVIHSDIGFTGCIETSNEKVNKLFKNTIWGQRGNFLDVPTDCPQRDERMGWTGDAQIFASTASYHMYTPAFYRKYMYDMLLEQREREGSVPHVVPDVLTAITNKQPELKRGPFGKADGSCAWADAATVIPWTVYMFYGDTALLAEQYESMKLWVDYIKMIDETECGGKRLWTHGFHFADWLALDNPVQGQMGGVMGGTDVYYIASCYYYYSATLTAKAAVVLGNAADAAHYTQLADEVKAAIQKEYFTATGRLAANTQTGYVLALFLGLVPEVFQERAIEALKNKFKENRDHLDTGFVGTGYLCNTLSQIGMTDLAYTLLLHEDYPSWLYEVNMGATTIWERWNSVNPDGLLSDTGMNSLNHYSYGAIADWMYRYMCGINAEKPGFKSAILAPIPDARFDYAKARYDSATGTYQCGWKRDGDKIIYTVTVPFDATATFKLPAPAAATINGNACESLATCGCVTLTKGTYEIIA